MPANDISHKYLPALRLSFLFIISCVGRLANPVWCGPRAAQKVATSKQQTAQMSIFPFGPENYLAKDYLSLPADVVFLQR